MYTPDNLPQIEVLDEMEDLVILEGLAHADWIDIPFGLRKVIDELNAGRTVQCYNNLEEDHFDLTMDKIKEGLCKWFNENYGSVEEFDQIDCFDACNIIQLGVFGAIEID